MRKVFFAGVIGLILFELANVYFIMPLPGSQRMRSVDAAYLVVIVLASDSASFYAFARPAANTRFTLRGDSLVAAGRAYALSGRGASDSLVALNASQEFWHSWREFQPRTERY